MPLSLQRGARRLARLLVTVFLPITLLLAQPGGAGSAPTVKVMTRNMDAGTDLNYVLAATDDALLAQGLSDTYVEVKNSGIPVRAARLANEIAAQMPDLIGLQEVTLWRTGPLSLQPTGVSDVLYDQLDLLMTELASRKLHYSIVVTQSLVDIEVPVALQNLNLRFTDRDVILARNDLMQSDLDLSNIQAQRFDTLLELPLFGGLTLLRGFESVDVNARGKTFRFFNTHLETTDPRLPQTVRLQLAQARELLNAARGRVPVVLLGDFNANAEPGPEHTGAVELILAGGYLDAWHTLYPHDPGFTWPLFGEDQLQGKPVQPNERIDLIFARGLTPLSIQRLSYGLFSGPPASDHAGVVATLQIDR